MVTPKPGIYPGVPFSTYASWDAVNSSRLNKMTDGSPKHFLANISEATAATNLGRVYHSLVLTPERFDQEFVLADDCAAVTGKGTRCKKKGTRVVDGEQFCSIHIPKGAGGDEGETSVVNPSTWDAAHRMMEATLMNDHAVDLLEGTTREVGYVWEEESSGLLCKGLIDADNEGLSAIVDLKSTRAVSPDAFRKSIFRYGYHRQIAFYANGMLQNGNRRQHFYWVAQESLPPYDCVVYKPSADMIDQAATTLYRWLSEIGQCITDDRWPGFGAYGVVELDMPEWMMNQEEEH